MNFKRNLSFILGSVMIASSLAGCGQTSDVGYTLHDEMFYKHDADDGIYEIAVVTKSSKSEYWNKIVEGMMDRADEFQSVKVVEYSVESERDINGNNVAIEKAIAWESDAIVIGPSSFVDSVNMVDYADSKNIPVVMADSISDTNTFDAFVGTNNKEIGTKAGELLADGINNGGKVFVLSNLEQSWSEQQRIEMFLYEMQKNHPNVDVVAIEYCSGVYGSAYDTAVKYFATNTDIQGVYAVSPEATIAVADAVADLDIADRITVIGTGETEAISTAIELGFIDACFALDPYAIGVNSFNLALAIIQGNELLETEVITEYSIIK